MEKLVRRGQKKGGKVREETNGVERRGSDDSVMENRAVQEG